MADLTEFDDFAEPRCSTEGIVMRPVEGGWQCPSCGEVVAPVIQMPPRPRFNGPAIRGG